MSKSVFFILLICNVFANAAGNEQVSYSLTDKASDLLIYDENAADALRVLTQEIQASYAQKKHKETSVNIYWIAECLLHLREIRNLEYLFSKCSSYVEINHPESYKKLQNTYGKYLIEKGKYDECLILLSGLLKNSNDISISCEIQLTMADAYMRIQKPENSRTCYDVVIKQAKDSLQMARGFNGIGSYFCLLAQLDSAKISYDRAYSILYKKVGIEHSRTAQVLYNLGLVADRKVDYFAAENYFQKSLSVYTKRLGSMHPKTADAFGALGSLYLMEDNPEKALHYSLKEKNIIEKIYGPEHPQLVYSYLNLGKIYYLLSDLASSEFYLLSAIGLVKKQFGLQHNLYKQCVVELSKIWTGQKKHKESRQLLEEAKQLNRDEYSGDIYLQSGENYLEEQLYDKAIHDFNEANKLYTAFYGNKNIYSTNALIGISNASLKQQKHPEAYKKATEAYSMTLQGKKIIYPYDNWVCMVQMLECKKAIYQHQTPDNNIISDDIKQIGKAISVANTIRHTLYTPVSQAYFTERMSVLNRLGIYFLTKWYKKRDAFFYNQLIYFSENDKANLLRSKIINYESNEILPEKERKKASYITSKLNYFNALNEESNSQPVSITDSILSYQSKFESFTRHIEQQYPKIHYLKYGNKNITIDRIQEALKDDYSLLEYFNDDENYYCISISNYDIRFKDCGKVNYIDSLVSVLLSSILNKHYHKEAARILSKQLLPDNLQENLIIAASNMLNSLSFDVLQKENNYLLFHHTTQYAFSASTYFLHRTPVRNKNIIAVFPDYEGSAYPSLNTVQEKKSLLSFSGYEVLEQVNISKENLFKKSAAAGIIHFGAHIEIDTLAPLHSSIVLQPQSNKLLSINEIWRLNLNTQLVTLAACQSNYGKLQNGEGIKNFAWAFHYAGARNILSTQWNAPDKSTSKIVSEFYTHLKKGKTKEESLQAAKLNFLKNSDAIAVQPFYWSNFFLYGDESSIQMAPHFFVKFWWMPILMLLLCYIALIIFRNFFSTKVHEHL